ncbi:MAG: hypothetical protein H7Z43_06055 [Clostridia bacterium]|nr:hypothetical protein [Deltaproteobacteria bacterium]
MRYVFKALLTLIAAVTAVAAQAQTGLVPSALTDHSATRVDAEVFGWSADYQQVAAVALSTHRNSAGGQRGQVLFVVWDVDSIIPVDSIETNIIQAADLPHAPVAVPEAKEKLDEVDYNIGSQWPIRPRRMRPDGWMAVDTIWDPVQVNASDCMPAVAFVLAKGDALRFQPHQKVSDLQASCAQLRLGHTRTYWAKADLAVVMARFDYSPTENEMSFRQPVSAKWSNAHELRFLVKTDDAASPRTLRTVRNIGRYGKVRVVSGSAQATSNFIVTRANLKLLGERFARELGVQLVAGTPEGDVDVAVTFSGNDFAPAAVVRNGNKRISKR